MTRRRNKLQPVGDLLLTIRERAAALTKGQQQVAAAMLADPDFALRANVDALARRAKVSPPTIIRFCRALGFAGLREFKLHLAQSLAVGTSTLHRAVVPGDNMQAVTHKVLQGAASALANLEQHIGRMPFLLETVDVAKEQGAMIIAITRPDTPLAERADVVLPVVVPADPSMRVGTEAYLAQMAYLEILMVGTGLRRGPPALRQLKRVRQVLQERGVDSETHPVLERAWSNGEVQPS